MIPQPDWPYARRAARDKINGGDDWEEFIRYLGADADEVHPLTWWNTEYTTFCERVDAARDAQSERDTLLDALV